MFSVMPLITIVWATDISVVQWGEIGCHNGNFAFCK